MEIVPQEEISHISDSWSDSLSWQSEAVDKKVISQRHWEPQLNQCTSYHNLDLNFRWTGDVTIPLCLSLLQMWPHSTLFLSQQVTFFVCLIGLLRAEDPV